MHKHTINYKLLLIKRYAFVCIHDQLSMQEIAVISAHISTLQIIYSITDHIVLHIRRFTSKLATPSFQQHAASITQLRSRYPNRTRLVCGSYVRCAHVAYFGTGIRETFSNFSDHKIFGANVSYILCHNAAIVCIFIKKEQSVLS